MLNARHRAALCALVAGAGALCALPALAQEGGQSASGSRLGLQLQGGQPIQIESDKLEVQEQESKATFTGNVNVTQGTMLLKSGRMVVYYAKRGDGASAATGSSDIERIEVDDKVYVKSENQVATGDRGTFDMRSEVLILSGKEVVLTEGSNVLVGCKLTVQMKSGLSQVDGCGNGGSGRSGNGRVIMSIVPSSGNGAGSGN